MRIEWLMTCGYGEARMGQYVCRVSSNPDLESAARWRVDVTWYRPRIGTEILRARGAFATLEAAQEWCQQQVERYEGGAV
jgi:hypothetical protein